RKCRQKRVCIHQSVFLDPALSRPPASEDWRSRPFLLTVAQHRSNKNLGLLLSGFRALRASDDKYRDLQLLIVGAEGPETPSLHALAARDELRESVAFRSALPDAELC